MKKNLFFFLRSQSIHEEYILNNNILIRSKKYPSYKKFAEMLKIWTKNRFSSDM